MSALFRYGIETTDHWPKELLVTEELIHDGGVVKLNEGAIEICDGTEIAIYRLEEYDLLRRWWRCSLFAIEKKEGA